MTLPAVDITELDGALGVLPSSAGRLLAVVGVSSKGPKNLPSTFARVPDLVGAFGHGPMVEAAAHALEHTRRPVAVVRTAQATPGGYPGGAKVEFRGAGDSTVTVDEDTGPLDDLEPYAEVVTGGTVGEGGIALRWSLDGGRTLSPVTLLGTASRFVFPTSGGVAVDFGAGTLAAGDRFTFRTTAPHWGLSPLAVALRALFASRITWDIVHVVGPIDAKALDVVDARVRGASREGAYRSWIGNTRMPAAGESAAEYRASLTAALGNKATTHGCLGAGACRLVSGVSARQYRRPIAYAFAAREASVSEEQNTAEIDLGPLPSVSIRDAHGNPDEHDEALSPGLDDARFVTLRTWDDEPGVYVTWPRLFSALGSDFQIHPHRRVLNLAHAALRRYFLRRLAKEIVVHEDSGFILESEALEIESGARAAMRTVLLGTPKASAAQFALSRTDNLLSDPTLRGTARVVPLAYAKFIHLDVGFLNPALAVRTA